MANMATASLLMLATACTLLAQASAGPRSAQTAIGHCRGLGGGCLLPSHDPTRCWRANEEYKTTVEDVSAGTGFTETDLADVSGGYVQRVGLATTAFLPFLPWMVGANQPVVP
uniref:Putative secreted protein n=1 Tax=Amblyomma tuberculatum TaxID=48802 RepID=A0A6M2E298_9ACAR